MKKYQLEDAEKPRYISHVLSGSLTMAMPIDSLRPQHNYCARQYSIKNQLKMRIYSS